MQVVATATSDGQTAEAGGGDAGWPRVRRTATWRRRESVGQLRLRRIRNTLRVRDLAGSQGGLGGPSGAALLTGHGIATLALAHWRYPGTPDHLRDIPIEVVGRGCDWLRRQLGVADRRPTGCSASPGR